MSEPILIRVDHARLDAAVAPAFKDEISARVTAGERRVLLDLSAVQFMDSTGLGVLVSLLKRMGGDGKIAVVGAGPAVLKLLQLTRLDTLFTICGSEDEARDALQG
ncbi:STAS domain-containing protein [Croceicoccus bisphenolivorans]|uniref:STAS domain-containing protein n=1 Tax=Croceicoccus bisphenolivorans TaxID=1783232 RepID=UPI00082CC71D|nr:STAS domain-containing protein [Croceicoccus bisphenolivorans]